MKKILVILVAVVLVVFAVRDAAFSAEEKPLTLVYESVYPKGHFRFNIDEEMLDTIEAQSKGRIKFDRHYTEPVNQKEALNALTRGTIDILVAYPTYYDGKIAIGDWQQMPANFRNAKDAYELTVAGPVADIMDKVYTKYAKVKYLTCTPVAPYNFQIAKKAKKIKTFEDFKGMKIRSAGGSASIALKMMGAAPVMTIGGEYYQAMQTGVVDAGLMTTYSLQQYRLWEVADQVVDPPLVGYSTAFMWMSMKAWDKLSKDQQALVLKVTRSKELWDKWVKIHEQEQDGAIIAEAKSRGVEFYVLPETEAEKMYKATMPVWDWYVAECEKQGTGAEAREVRKLLLDRFFAKKK
jgi:TRAP-type transport system periplasmic protein